VSHGSVPGIDRGSKTLQAPTPPQTGLEIRHGLLRLNPCASLFTSHAISYRENRGFDHGDHQARTARMSHRGRRSRRSATLPSSKACATPVRPWVHKLAVRHQLGRKLQSTPRIDREVDCHKNTTVIGQGLGLDREDRPVALTQNAPDGASEKQIAPRSGATRPALPRGVEPQAGAVRRSTSPSFPR